MRASLVIVIAFASAGAVGCAKKAPTEGGVRLTQVSDSFAAAGFKMDGYRPIDAGRFSAQTCSSGPLDGVDTLVCEYATADAAASAAAHKAAEAWIAESVTGAVLNNGRTVLAVADRGHADPNGKTVHRITQTFQKTR